MMSDIEIGLNILAPLFPNQTKIVTSCTRQRIKFTLSEELAHGILSALCWHIHFDPVAGYFPEMLL